MLEFLMEYFLTIAIGLVVLAVVLLAVVKMVRDHRQGKHSCSCGCTGCKGIKNCHSMEK